MGGGGGDEGVRGGAGRRGWGWGMGIPCKKKLREIPMWTTVARTKRRGGRKIRTPTSFGFKPPMSTSEFGAF